VAQGRKVFGSMVGVVILLSWGVVSAYAWELKPKGIVEEVPANPGYVEDEALDCQAKADESNPLKVTSGGVEPAGIIETTKASFSLSEQRLKVVATATEVKITRLPEEVRVSEPKTSEPLVIITRFRGEKKRIRSPQVIINQKDIVGEVPPEVPPIIRSSRTMVSVEESFFNPLGERVSLVRDFRHGAQSVFIIRSRVVIKLTVGSKKVVINGESFEMDVSPYVCKGHMMVPLRAICEALGFQVNWDSENYQAVVTG